MAPICAINSDDAMRYALLDGMLLRQVDRLPLACKIAGSARLEREPRCGPRPVAYGRKNGQMMPIAPLAVGVLLPSLVHAQPAQRRRDFRR